MSALPGSQLPGPANYGLNTGHCSMPTNHATQRKKVDQPMLQPKYKCLGIRVVSYFIQRVTKLGTLS